MGNWNAPCLGNIMTSPCPHCKDTTDHETPESLSACTAGLEGWFGVKTLDGVYFGEIDPEYAHELRGGLGLIGYPPTPKVQKGAGLLYRPIPNYPNDANETVRMLEALLKADMEPERWCGKTYVGPSYLRNATARGLAHEPLIGYSETKEAIHRAYHAMLLSEWVEKQGEGE